MKITVLHFNTKITFDLKDGVNLVGRSEKSDIRLAPEWTVASGAHLTIEARANGKYYIYDGWDGKPSTNGTQVNNHYISSGEETEITYEDEIKIGDGANESIRMQLLSTTNNIQSENASNLSERRTNDDITIGRGAECTIPIQGATISRLHAIIRRRGESIRLIDNSQNGTFLNGEKINRTCPIKAGDEIKIGTNIFRWTGSELAKETSGKRYRIDIIDLYLKGRISGTSLSIEPGQLVAFVGGSGAGKSSLLTTIVGQNMEYTGSIQINGDELRESYKSIKQEIGFVPQDDIVHMDLTVEEVLKYSARLKLPDPESQREAIEKTLAELEIGHRRKARIKDLSGGQRKRVSIGVEMIADPRILFLDEPTSGLDPGLDKRMMQLLRRIADSGRTVALVTHATNNVMLCDQVVFLGRGGYLCYAGDPGKCAEYFGVNGDFSDVYQRLEVSGEEIKQLSLRFKESQNFSQKKLTKNPRRNSQSVNDISSRLKEYFPQLKTLISRDFKLQSRDLTSLILNAVTAPAAALMLAIAANNRDIFISSTAESASFADAQRILFVIVCSTIWVGLSSSLQSMVKERAIFKRERAFNLIPEAYLTSKLIVMIAASLLQSLLLALAVGVLFESPGDTASEWPIRIGIAAFVTLIAVGSQGLLVSSVVKNSQQASSIAPILLIPQLVFGGVLFNLTKNSENIYYAVSSRWSMILMGCWSNITDLIPLPPGASIESSLIPGADRYENTTENVHEAISVLSIQFALFISITLISLLFSRKNRQ